MRGTTILYSILSVILFGCGVLSTPVRAADNAAKSGPVAVLLSDSEAIYSASVKAFRAEAGRPVKIFNLRGDIKKDPDLKRKLFASQPELIFALGAKAAYTAKLWTQKRQEIPVLFAMVFNWQRYKLLSQKNMAGIAAEIVPGTKFANIMVFSPDIKRIGVIHSVHSREVLKDAQKAADILDIELQSKEISRSKNFRRAFKEMSRKVDAFLVLNDPVVYTLDNMDWLKIRCLKEKLPCIGQSRNIAELGLVLSINPDMADIGSQAASMAENIIKRHQRPDLIGVMAPLGTQVLINRTTAERIGLELGQASIDMATQVID
jgi:putative ABC transport system substrate-binding protein